MAEERPRSVELWRKRQSAARAACGTRCRKHAGVCDRKNSHPGLHTHPLLDGMKGYEPRDPSKGCTWDDQPHPVRHRRPRSVEKGPLDGFV